MTPNKYATLRGTIAKAKRHNCQKVVMRVTLAEELLDKLSIAEKRIADLERERDSLKAVTLAMRDEMRSSQPTLKKINKPMAWLWSHRKHQSEVTLVRPEDDDKAEAAQWSGWSYLALYALPPVPDGWIMVPVEPTEDMIVQGFESEPDESFSDADVWEAYDSMSGCQQAAHRAKLCWAAMIAAAQKPHPSTSSKE